MKTFMMYMVGISGSGKTTIATKLVEELRKRNYNNLQFIDGDVIRAELGDIFGYTFEERMKANKTACVVANYLIKNGISVILAQVGAYEAMRRQVRNIFKEKYIEVYVKCSVEECARRDVKGYYKKVENGDMQNLNGANDVYEIPINSDIVLDTETFSVSECVDKILAYLKIQLGDDGKKIV